VIAALRDWFDTFGETPLSYDWSPRTAELLGMPTQRSEEWMRQYPRWPSTATVFKHFGTWASAVRASDLPPARAIAQGRGLAERVEATLSLTASGYGAADIAVLLEISPRTVRSYLRAGSCRDCGGVVITADRCPRCAARRANRPYWTRRQVVDAMRAWTAEEGRVPTTVDWTPTADRWRKWARDYPRWPSYDTVRTLYGSWRNGIEAAGLRVRTRRWRGEDVVAALRGFAATHGRSPTQADLERFEELPSPATVRAHLGSLRAALERAGLGVRRRRWDRDLILTAVARFAREHGRLPAARDWTRSTGAHPHATTVLQQFGSWSAAMAAAKALRLGPSPDARH
jgi:DNA-binding CsgD family transcriptional regulator